MSENTKVTHCSDCGDQTTCWDTNMEGYCNPCAKKLTHAWWIAEQEHFESDWKEAYQD